MFSQPHIDGTKTLFTKNQGEIFGQSKGDIRMGYTRLLVQNRPFTIDHFTPFFCCKSPRIIQFIVTIIVFNITQFITKILINEKMEED